MKQPAIQVILLSALCLLATRVQAVEPPPPFVGTWGTHGIGNGQFNCATSITSDSLDNIYVMDSGNYRVQKFDKNGAFLVAFGSHGSGVGQFLGPCSVVIDDKNAAVYVVDKGNNSIQKFTTGGGFVTTFGSEGQGNGQFGFCGDPIPGVDISLEQVPGGIVALDPGNDRVQTFDFDGNFLSQFGSTGSGDGQFDHPSGVVIDDKNAAIYVTDQGNSRIQKFSMNGTFLTKFGSQGTGSGSMQFCGDPIPGVDISLEQVPGGIIAMDPGNNRLQKFLLDGTFVSQVGSFGSGPGQMKFIPGAPNNGCSPRSTPGGVIALDPGNHRIQKFDSGLGFQFQLGGYGTGSGQFINPAGFTLGRRDSAIYVLDAGNSRIQKFANPSAISVSDDQPSARLRFQAAPNPSAGQTTISFVLEQAGSARIAIYDVAGRRLRQWSKPDLAAGRHQFTWDGLTEDGQAAPAGLLFTSLESGGQVLKQQMIRL